MTGDTTRARPAAGRGGFLPSLLALANGLASFFESRLELFASESKRALVQMLVLLALLGAALLFLALGYIFLIVTAAAALAALLGVDWIWVALGGAVLHFLLAFVLVLVARGRMTQSPFPETAAELRKDREWLRSLDHSSRPLN
jgi:uncharacterized membrane protein YqjE